MKLIKLKHSFLLLRVNPKTDNVKCLFIFFINWNTVKIEKQSFELDKLSVSQIKEFYNKLAFDYVARYRID